MNDYCSQRQEEYIYLLMHMVLHDCFLGNDLFDGFEARKQNSVE